VQNSSTQGPTVEASANSGFEVGYSLTRKRRERGCRREELTRFGPIPSHKVTLLWLAARYALVEKSILVVTEGLGQRRFHGRIVSLVNEHTASAGDMVSAFAEENSLATIVGTKTPGGLLRGSACNVGHGYILGLPGAAYITWQGRMLQNNGIVPKFRDRERDSFDSGVSPPSFFVNGSQERYCAAASGLVLVSNSEVLPVWHVFDRR